jgi:hypothetical protein
MKLRVTHIIFVAILTFVCSELLMSQGVMYWESNFDPITLPNITMQTGESEGEAEVTLFTSGDAEISADNTTTAQLSSATDTLLTEYKLKFDGDGTTKTGGATVGFSSYDSFLSTPAYVTYVTDDNDVKVTLSVNAKNYNDQVANAGTYTATQTLIVHWVGP